MCVCNIVTCMHACMHACMDMFYWLHCQLPVLLLIVVPLPDTAGHHNLEVAHRAGLVDRLKGLALKSYYLL